MISNFILTSKSWLLVSFVTSGSSL